jgi:hypothetical protein
MEFVATNYNEAHLTFAKFQTTHKNSGSDIPSPHSVDLYLTHTEVTAYPNRSIKELRVRTAKEPIRFEICRPYQTKNGLSSIKFY